MKQTIGKITRAIMPVATFVLVITSCQKTQTIPVMSNVSGTNARLASTASSQNIPSILQVPKGNVLASQAYAKGVQIYEVKPSTTDPATYNWVLVGPSAILYADANYTIQVGTHSLGPIWKFTKGFNEDEMVGAKKLQESKVDPTAIPWLLLQAVEPPVSSSGNKVTYIQRIYTTGGLAPATGADKEHLGQQVSIPYTAIYNFYEKKS